MLKGRSNYLCRQRAAEVGGAEEAGLAGVALFDERRRRLDAGRRRARPAPAPETVDLGRLGGQLRRLIAWAETSPTGDRAELDFEPNPRAWAALSVSARECPGAFRCPRAPICFAEQARERAAAADVVVVNTHLYATHVASDGAVLPEHDVVVLDEAHAVEDIMTAGTRAWRSPPGACGPWPRRRAACVGADDAARRRRRGRGGRPARRRAARRWRAGASSPPAPATTRRPQSQELAAVLELAGGRLGALNGALRRAPTTGSPGRCTGGGGGVGAGAGDDEGARRNRALLAVGHLGEELSSVIGARRRAGGLGGGLGAVGAHRDAAGRAHRRRAAAGRSACGPTSPPCSPRPRCPPSSRARLGLPAAHAPTTSTWAARSPSRPAPCSTAPSTSPTPAAPRPRRPCTRSWAR